MAGNTLLIGGSVIPKKISIDSSAFQENNFYRDGSQFATNAPNGIIKANLRLEYEFTVNAQSAKAQQMLKNGVSEEKVARWAVEQRNNLKTEYRELTPPDMLKGIEQRNIKKYGNPLGPTADQLHQSGKSWKDIINSSSRAGGDDLNFAPPGFNRSKK